MPHIIVQSSSKTDLGMQGPCHNVADALDPNGNPVHSCNHLAGSNLESGKGVFLPLRTSLSEPGNALTADETRGDDNFDPETDAPFRPTKR